MNDRLYRSRDDRMLAGVAGGLAERFDLDPALVRVLWVIVAFLSGGIFLLAYVVMAIVVPEEPLGAGTWPAGAPIGTAFASERSTASGAATTAAFTASTPPEAGGPGPGPSDDPAAGSDPSAVPDVGAAVAGASVAADAPLWPATPPPAAPPPIAPSSVPPEGSPPPPSWTVSERRRRHERRGGGAIIGGIVLVLLGGYFLLRTMVPELDAGAFWPVLLIVIGIALLIGSVRPGRSPDA